jgi:hypothetical protein
MALRTFRNENQFPETKHVSRKIFGYRGQQFCHGQFSGARAPSPVVNKQAAEISPDVRRLERRGTP